jgi:hypothetical protein
VPDTTGSVDLNSLAPDEQEALEKLAAERGDPPTDEPQQEEVPEVLTAFLVIVDKEFNPTVSGVNDPRFKALLPVTRDLIFGAASVIVKDLGAQEGALATAEVMQAQAQQMMAQAQEASIRSRLASEGGVMGVRG